MIQKALGNDVASRPVDNQKLVGAFPKIATVISVICVLGFWPSISRADTVVDPSNMGDWSFVNSDVNGDVNQNPTGSGSMVTGPATPPAGIGSANLATGNGTTGGDGAELLSNTGYSGVSLSSLTALTYWTFDTLNNGQQFPYLSLEVSYMSGGLTLYDQLFFEPPYQTPSSGNPGLPNQGQSTQNEWQSWNAVEGGWWDNSSLCGNPGTGVVSLATCIAALPDATIVNSFGVPGVLDGVGGLQFAVGFASPTDQFNGYVDDFTIGVNGVDTTFDFEPNPTAVPEPASIAILGTALTGFGIWRRRKKSV